MVVFIFVNLYVVYNVMVEFLYYSIDYFVKNFVSKLWILLFLFLS